VLVLVGVEVGVRDGVGDLKPTASWVCCAARVSAAWVKAAPEGGEVGTPVGWLETVGRHAPVMSAAHPITSNMIPVFTFTAFLLYVIG
jgi:hypothetical protein